MIGSMHWNDRFQLIAHVSRNGGGSMRIRIVAFGMLVLLSVAAVTAAMQNGNDLYQQGLARETAGDIKGAIQIFERIVQDFSSNRALTAKALLQLGQSSDLLGQDKGRKYYERVIREFADQTEATAEARKRITALDAGRPAAVTARRVNMPADVTHDLSITPDGRLAVIIDRLNGGLAIYDISSGQIRRLTPQIEPFRDGYSEGPVLSPDMRQVAFAWYDYKELRQQLRIIANQPGAQPRVLINNPEFEYLEVAGWSRDGKSILASMWKADETVQLAWISVADGAVKSLKSFGWRELDRPSLSPDGRYIVYSATESVESVKRAIYVLTANGSSETELVKGAGINEAPAWTPDGARVFFTSNRSGGFALWSIAVENGRAAGSPELVKPDIGRISALGFSSSGTYHYMHVTTSTDVFVAELDPASSTARGPAVRLTETFTGSRFPAWSPDGKAVAFLRGLRGRLGTGDLVVRSLETGQERIYAGEVSGDQLLWFPDCKSLLVTVNRAGQSRLYRVDLGTGQFTLARDLGFGAKALAPDGRTVYVMNYYQTYEGIEAFDLVTGKERQVFKAPEPQRVGARRPMLALSPDGQTLAFQLGRRTFLIGVDGRGFRELPTGDVGGLEWSKDGRAILFASERKLMRLSVEGGEPQFTGLADISPAFDLSADGSRIGFTRGAAGANRIVEVWALDNLLAKR
jgi:Tol biopolymer transport system component